MNRRLAPDDGASSFATEGAFMRKLAFLTILLCGFIAAPAQAKLRVFACETDWASLLHELAGDAVSVDVATTALQDVHA